MPWFSVLRCEEINNVITSTNMITDTTALKIALGFQLIPIRDCVNVNITAKDGTPNSYFDQIHRNDFWKNKAIHKFRPIPDGYESIWLLENKIHYGL